MSDQDRYYWQDVAVLRWAAKGFRGVVVAPTGAGKSYVAVKAIRLALSEGVKPILYVVPTNALLQQQYMLLANHFLGVSRFNGSDKRINTVTVTTYSSAYRYLERFERVFRLAVFDECHHLYSSGLWGGILRAFRRGDKCFLGLTATPDFQLSF